MFCPEEIQCHPKAERETRGETQTDREGGRERAAFVRPAVLCFSCEPHFVNTRVDCELHEGKRVLHKCLRGHPYMMSALRGEGGLDQKKMY